MTTSTTVLAQAHAGLARRLAQRWLGARQSGVIPIRHRDVMRPPGPFGPRARAAAARLLEGLWVLASLLPGAVVAEVLSVWNMAWFVGLARRQPTAAATLGAGLLLLWATTTLFWTLSVWPSRRARAAVARRRAWRALPEHLDAPCFERASVFVDHLGQGVEHVLALIVAANLCAAAWFATVGSPGPLIGLATAMGRAAREVLR